MGAPHWAIDLRQELLDYMGRRLEVEELENVEMKKVEPDGHMAEAGFKVVAEYDSLPEQYFVVYRVD